jgi:hypothetical protein
LFEIGRINHLEGEKDLKNHGQETENQNAKGSAPYSQAFKGHAGFEEREGQKSLPRKGEKR